MNAPYVSVSLMIYPQAAMHIAWSEDARHAHVTPVSRWQTDTRYQLIVPADAQLANGSKLGAPIQFAFTTQTAPTITAFSVMRGATRSAQAQLTLEESSAEHAAPADTAAHTSSRASVT